MLLPGCAFPFLNVVSVDVSSLVVQPALSAGAGVARNSQLFCHYVPPRGSTAVISRDPAIGRCWVIIISDAAVSFGCNIVGGYQCQDGDSSRLPGAFLLLLVPACCLLTPAEYGCFHCGVCQCA